MRLLVSGATETVAELAPKWPLSLGHLLTPKNWNSVESLTRTGLAWAVDNGAFSGFDPVAFRRCLARVAGQPRLLWIACPDVVGNAKETVALYGQWAEEVRQAGPVAFVLQDGQEDLDLPIADAYFVGGSTAFKLSTAAAGLCDEAKQRLSLLHMGRVNSFRRMEVAAACRCDSIDGSSASKWPDRYVAKFLKWLKRLEGQQCLYR